MAPSFQPRNNKKHRVISEINVTPFVDVLLVLLIIFMVAAPMMTSSVSVNLPTGAAKQEQEKIQPITISVKSDGSMYLQEDQIKLRLLPNKLLELTGNNLDNKIYVRADKSLDYGRVMEVVRTVSITGFNQVILVTEVAQ